MPRAVDLNRTQRDLLGIIAFRDPPGCWLVPAVSGAARWALVVPEMTRGRTWARLRTVGTATVEALLALGLVRYGVRDVAPPEFSGRRPCDGTSGRMVHATPGGRGALGWDPPLSMPAHCEPAGTVSAAEWMARIRDKTRGTPEGSVDAEIRAIRGGGDDEEELLPPRLVWVPVLRPKNTLGESLGGYVLALLDEVWVNIESGEVESGDPLALRGVVELVAEGPEPPKYVLDSISRTVSTQ